MRLPRAKKRTSGFSNSPKTAYYPIEGGEDLVSSSLSVSPKRLRFSINYECDDAGKPRRIDGYEVCDGRPKPSEASYSIIDYTSGWAITSEAVVVGGTSSATGVCLTQVVESGDTVDGSAVGYLVITNVSGTFVSGEVLTVSGVSRCTTSSAAIASGADTAALHATYLQDAIDYTRDQITAVPGSGPVLGVWQYNGTKYAFRDDEYATAAKMYKSTSAGWIECDLGASIAFTTGSTEIEEDDVVEGATGGATATVKRVILESGTWAGGDAAGTLILYSQVGNFQSENLDVQGGGSSVATIGGDSTAVSLQVGGNYRFVNHNFYGSSSYFRMYGCDGVNKGFEWDGDTFVQITTGMDVDAPTFVGAFKGHLFFAFPGGSLQHSSIGTPYEWSAITGAAELGIGDDITGLLDMIDVLVIYSRNSISLLSGTSIDDWSLDPYSGESGAIENTVQKIGSGFFTDDRGITTLSAVDTYGDFETNTISKAIKPYLDSKLSLISSSIRVRGKNQYRLFFSDGFGINITLTTGESGIKVAGITRLEYDVTPLHPVSTESSTGSEELLFGDEDGYVYQLDAGTSFNGNAIQAICRTHFNNLKTPSNRKRFRRVIPEVDAPEDANISVYADYSYGDETSVSQAAAISAYSIAGMLGESELGSFYLGGLFTGVEPLDIGGNGTNIAFLFISEATYAEPHTLQGVTIHYDIRRQVR